MKKLLFVLPLVALCACGGSKKGEVVESVQPITATVSIVDKDASRWFHSIVWDVEANSLNTKDLAQVNRVESEVPCADSLVLYSCVRSARGQKAISGGTSVDLGTQRYYTFLQDSARTTRRVVYEVPIGSGLTLTTPWLVEYEGARKSMEHINSSFARYAALTGKGGACIANADDENIMSSVEKYQGELITFGLSKPADYTAKDIRVEDSRLRYELVYHGVTVADINLAICGKHNVYNSMAAAAAAHSCGVSFESIEAGLSVFVGAGRRMEYKGRAFGADIYDDYGHHPTEVAATLRGAREMFPGRRIICVFQPHTFSRTAALLDKFKYSFDAADMVVLADIYAAREENVYGISSRALCESIGDRAIYGGSFAHCGIILQRELRENDVVVVMGAGDIYKIYSVL